MKNQHISLIYQAICAVPEIIVVLLILFMSIMIIITRSNVNRYKLHHKIVWGGLSILLVIMLVYSSSNASMHTDMITHNYFTYQLKTFVVFGGVIWVICLNTSKLLSVQKQNIYILILCMIFSLMVIISSNHLLILYIGLELYTILVCFFVAVGDTNALKVRASLKYLILSSIIAAIFLYGASLYYLGFGSLSFNALAIDLQLDSLYAVGVLLILTYLLFKLNVVPFHIWSIDVYDKSSFELVLFLETISKLIIFAVFSCLCATLVANGIIFFQKFLIFIAIGSMLVGGIAPFFQNNIKKFIAYSSAGQIGFVLMVPGVLGQVVELRHAVIYICSYFLSVLCLFMGFIGVKKTISLKSFSNMEGIIKTHPIYAYAILCGFLSIIGLPPFIGFIAKFEVFSLLMQYHRYDLAVIAIIYIALTIAYTANALKGIFKSTEKTVQYKRKSFWRATNIYVMVVLVMTSVYFKKMSEQANFITKYMIYTPSINETQSKHLTLLDDLLVNENVKALYDSLTSDNIRGKINSDGT